ncbi:ABC transporter ATP-binding protein [Amycolatopsis sp. NBC_01480]|jgi:sulfonate transport system ATP-binding protein|uniref:ABC transporter ATP-binding protein n=1 Tax=Amycolatopsis sp. NBC_01480 TaxID=2903562 RepID=UPI002E2AAE2C|nr:ABC transporter ATP-binding protein [Amycolatopsis sp. NBC_01480]
MAPPLIELIGATKRFPSGSGSVHTAVRELSMTVDPGEFVAVVGPTGCGKSTTLSLVSGLQPASAGQVRVNGAEVTAIPDGVGYMFQTDAVMPWRSVLDNVASGPRFRGESKVDARAKATDWIARVGLAGFEKYYPHQLSGGMRKRVALAQTLVTDPKILLMDEPFSALDVQTRALMQDELLRLWSGSGAAVIFVTHDLDEAIALADKVVVLTTSPATVKDVFEVPLERPRKVEDLRLTEEFRKIYSDIWESLRGEVDKARQKGATSVA